MHDSSRASVSRVLLWLFTAIALAIIQQPVRPPVRAVADSHRASSHMPAGLLPVLAQSLQRDAHGYDITPTDDRAFEARNPAHALDARFTADGASVRSRTAGVALTLRVQGYGTADSVSPAAPDAWVSHGGRIERAVRHGTTAETIIEWYVNSPLGLEQGFTLHGAPAPVAAPASDAPLVLDLDIDTTSDISLAADGRTIAFDGAAGEPGLTFGHLDVWDATGRRLPSRFAIDERRLRIEVKAGGAQYPITVDPLLRQAKLTASDGADGDLFGYAVAIDGDTAIVGAPNHTRGSLEQTGAACAGDDHVSAGERHPGDEGVRAARAAARDDQHRDRGSLAGRRGGRDARGVDDADCRGAGAILAESRVVRRAQQLRRDGRRHPLGPRRT